MGELGEIEGLCFVAGWDGMGRVEVWGMDGMMDEVLPVLSELDG